MGNYEVMALVHLGLMEKGINIAPRGMSSVSTTMTEKEIDAYITAFDQCLGEVKPFIKETAPDLIQ